MIKLKEDREQNQNSFLILLLGLKAAECKITADAFSEIIFFLAQYSFLFENSSSTLNSCDAEQNQLYILQENKGLGARYLDPKYSVWKSADPALGDYLPVAPVNDDAKKHNQSLPGNGGVFNVVNLNLYHYAGNNPVRYNDPTGESDVSQLLQTSRNMYIAAAAATQVDSPAIGPGDVAGAVIAIGATAVLAYAGLKAVFGWISSSISNTRTKTENGKILVSHYTSKEAADEIMSSGVIELGKWEAYVFAMKEPATAKEAENAGANSTEVKITFEVNANEVIKDKGTSQKKAVQFTIPGPIYIGNRNPVVTEN